MKRNYIQPLLATLLLFVAGIGSVLAQQELEDIPSQINDNKFRQLGQELPTPNVYRTASGAPGHEYWQQQADYNMRRSRSTM